MCNLVCDGAKDGFGARKYLIDRGPFVFTHNEKYLATTTTTNPSYELDLMCSGSMLERM